MDTAVSRQLVDKIYEKRKAAALELEKQVRECHQVGGRERIGTIIDQLVEMFSNNTNPLHVRNGGLIGLAGTAIALGVDIAPHMEKFVTPLLDCFVDPENKIRYFSAECLYNIAKVSKGEVLVYFNDIFDALSKLAADSEMSVKNGAELLDRLLKDIVAESAAYYIPLYPETEKVRKEREEQQGVLVTISEEGEQEPQRAFSLAHFVPLLRERIHVLSPFTRSYLVAWITVLDSVPELELVTYLPEFLDGLLKYLSDPIEDVRIATENLLADFLREIRDIAYVSRHLDEHGSIRRPEDGLVRTDSAESRRFTVGEGYDGSIVDSGDSPVDLDGSSEDALRESPDQDDRGAGVWIPGQGVRVDYAAIIEILIQQLDNEHDEIQQSTALRWLAEFLTWAHEVMVPFTPRLIPCVLPNLAHHVPMIQTVAIKTNRLLYDVIKALPSPADQTTTTTGTTGTAATAATASTKNEKINTPPLANRIPRSPTPTATMSAAATATVTGGTRPGVSPDPVVQQPPQAAPTSRPPSPISTTSGNGQQQSGEKLSQSQVTEDGDLFDYQATVNVLTIQFLSEWEETRVTTLKWLIMLHQKAPKKILSMEDGTFPALLKTLNDSSEEVIKHDLQLIAQISSLSEEGYFKAFMHNLLELFSTDRRLLEARGSLIIRQLCLNMNTEKIYRTFAEIVEKEEDLEFASVIVQKLNLILITSPELADFRRRLKNLETRQDGQALFTSLYRSWCHNAVSVFSLCLLAQAYEHASNLLYIFADLEVTVQMLVQIDKLVQLIESPVFTYIRLQLLEPEKYPYLFKCLYGVLMLLPQSSAFVSLRNRLNAVNSAGFLHIAPKPTPNVVSSTRSRIGREDIKWQELLTHFRSVQVRHEKARRQAMGGEGAPMSMSGYSDRDLDLGGLHFNQKEVTGDRSRPPTMLGRPNMRRRVTGEVSTPISGIGRAGALSPLNPKARVTSGLSTGTVIGQPATGGSGSSIGGSALGGATNGFQAQKGGPASRRTTIDLGKKV
ncbi:ARM repeat-containing protein [Macrolepiota fuliginosa MF-IS2]|uniref:ARM repeat-containing protein n=1 Tax=Macrolepiota fuliginosa MF-IS2 TaxID=1400762 RepID=A0A9P6C3F2_9AGAR|nr:ARM repeat-containing protein [Macrolepiota fuliginosa MF-IS2]